MSNEQKGWGGQNPLMIFRNAYLRAIARAWSDVEFKQRLLNAKDIQVMLVNEDYMSNVVWQSLDIRLREEAPPSGTFDPAGGWLGGKDIFIIHIPSAPTVDMDKKLKALTAFYQDYPTMFGTNSKIKRALPPNLGVSEGEFLNFGAITLRAVEWVWNKRAHYDRILKDDDANGILADLFGYRSKWNFKLKFIEDSDAIWDSEKDVWRHINDNIVELIFPAFDMQQYEPYALQALTEYNSNGPEYPFTCM